MKKSVIIIVIMMMLAGCVSEKPTDIPKPSSAATPTVKKPIVTPTDSPTQTYVESDYDLEKSLPYGDFSLVKGDEYYFCSTDLKDYTVNIYKYSKKTNKINLFKNTDCEYIEHILFDANDNFYYLESDSNTLYRCNEEDDTPVINNILYVIYIERECIYYLDQSSTLKKYNIEDNTILEIAYLGENYFPCYFNSDIKNICLFQNHTTGGLYSVDVRNGNIQKILDEYRYLSSDNKNIINIERNDGSDTFTVFNLDSFETTEYVINGIIDMYIDSIQIYNDYLYVVTREYDDGINIDTDEIIYKYHLYIIDLSNRRIEDSINIFKSGEGGLESATFYNGKLYFYYWPNYNKGSSPNILEYNVETGKTKNIKLKEDHVDLYGHMEIALGYLFVYNISTGDDSVVFVDKIAIE